MPDTTHYLKRELYDLIKKDANIFEFLQRSSLDGIWYWDLETQQDEWLSPRFWEVLGYDPAEKVHLASEWQELINPDDLKEAMRNFYKHCADPNHPYDQVVRYRHRDGSTVWVRCRGIAIRNEAGKPIRLLGAHTDLTQLKRTEEQLENAARTKSAFLATMSHEIRTPMNGIIGMTDLLLDSDLTPEQRDYADTVQRSGQHLLGIINDILDFSKIEAGRLTFETNDFHLPTVIKDISDLMTEQARCKSLELSWLLHAEVPIDLKGDPGRLRQILTNLIGNAIKFTQEGEITVRVARAEETPDRVLIRFSITDTGMGIAPEAQACLFQPFSQVDVSTTRTVGGTGLGLAICKQLVEQMEGQIGVESVPGQGSTFWFTVWLTKQPVKAPVAPMRRSSLQGRRVCVVDSSATNRHHLEQYAIEWGLKAATVSDGYQALTLLKKAARRGEPFDLALLELEMPQMDGIQLGHAITADPALARTRLVLLTSVGIRGQANKAKQAGMAAYLTKPINPSELYDCLSVIVDPPVNSAANKVQGDSATVRSNNVLVTRHVLREIAVRANIRILVAEDNPVNQKVIVRQLEKIGYGADVITTGLEAVEASARFNYALVLMDGHMPAMDGMQATAMIRKHERDYGSRRLPIIAITASVLPEDQEKCLNAGMDGFISKPVNVKDLSAMINRWIPGEATSDKGIAADTSGSVTVEAA